MSANYKFIDHTADIACEVLGDTLEELFTASVEAWRSSVVEGTKYGEREIKKFRLTASSKEELLVDFISEINYYLFTRNWLCNLVLELEIKQKNNTWNLSTKIEGMPVSQDVEIKQEIKAITFHLLNIEKRENQYYTLIVFDI
ncbi:MAG: archease [Bacteroidetes bacterium]|nr:archease [Bacteroidota bacterium]